MHEYEFEKGEEIGYHGRPGIVKDIWDDGSVLVYFSDIDDTQCIEYEELLEQNL